MRLLHISDLHLGKRVNGFSMIEDQEYILREILQIARQEKIDGMLIAGDVYDKPVPCAEAVSLLDDFLTRAAALGMAVYLISGNHDSAQRLAFGGRILRESEKIFLSPVFDGKVEPIRMLDVYGPVNVWLLPFVKPATVRPYFPDAQMENYNDAFRAVLESLPIDQRERNILVAHQFVTGASRCESEEVSVGGMDNVDASLMEGFDYAALGHIHGPQHIGQKSIRYCGTPLKYSFSEEKHQKSVTVVDLQEKGNVEIKTVPLRPLRDMRKIRGTYDEVTLREFYENTNVRDYLQITLTDEEDIPNVMERLRVIYPNLMKLEYDNKRTRENQTVEGAEAVEKMSPLQHFAAFYEMQNNQQMSEEQSQFMESLIEKVWESI